MDRKLLMVGLGSLLLVGIVAVGAVLFGKPASFRGTMYVEPSPPAPEVDDIAHDLQWVMKGK